MTCRQITCFDFKQSDCTVYKSCVYKEVDKLSWSIRLDTAVEVYSLTQKKIVKYKFTYKLTENNLIKSIYDS